jgi:hypothetical protein
MILKLFKRCNPFNNRFCAVIRLKTRTTQTRNLNPDTAKAGKYVFEVTAFY